LIHLILFLPDFDALKRNKSEHKLLIHQSITQSLPIETHTNKYTIEW